MSIMVTGGLGYIGGRLVNYLHDKYAGEGIFIAEHPRRKIPDWAAAYNVIPLDLLSEESVRACVNKAKPDCIIHLAAINEKACADNPELADKVNHLGTLLLSESAVKNKVRKFIYFSTFHVYGKAAKGEITEQTLPEPVHPYASSHLDAEKALTVISGKDMHILIFRLSNSYGYPMDSYVDRWSLLVNDLCRQAVATGRMALNSSGKQKRDFIPLASVVEAVRYFLWDIPEKWGNGLYNLGSGNAISVSDMAHKVQELYYKKYKKNAQLIFPSNPDKNNGSIVDFRYSIDKLRGKGCFLRDDWETEIGKTFDLCQKIS